MRKLTILFAACSLGIMSCGNNNEPKKEETTATTAPAEKLPATSKLGVDGTNKSVAMLGDYYEMKDAFVATNAAQADLAANKLNASVDNLVAVLQNDSIGKSQIVYLDTIKAETKKMLALKDETADKKRVNFEKISDVMYVYLKNIDLKNAGVYREFCPMAFNDKGAYWLSNESEIKNPYFGKKMLECGEVKDSLK